MHKCLIFIAGLMIATPAFGQGLEFPTSPSSPIILQGKAEKKHHRRSSDEYFEGRRQEPQLDSPSLNKAATAATNALSAEDEQLLIEWDRWRNKFSKKVWLKLNEQLTGGFCINLGGILLTTGEGSPYHFRKGIQVTYICEVTNDRRITNLRVTSPSGDPTYDHLVLACVQSLNGKSSLKFPEGSKRTRVRTAATLKIGKAAFHETKYNDQEFVRLSDATD
ncbi:MAG: hypothetical protein K2X29_07935 [Candidatus Obscuribacterales bacterium]|nr:hypothetical protein [Candidatus Obscuribacterales bacterium]